MAEDRDLLLNPSATPEAKALYLKNYSGQRLRRLAERHRGSRHHDLYQGLRLVFEKLGSDQGCPPLGLPALGSFLFSPEALPDLQRAELGNEAFLDALRRLALTRDKAGLRLVDFRNLGSEELGSVYESLLELHPEVTTDPATFQLLTATGNERKTTGSYYTPDSLIQCLLDSALDPVLAEATKKPDPEKAILALKVCDPACGSGHFLIAAAHRIANRLASVQTGEEAPSPDAQRSALRDVIGHCLFGIDLNPMAVELCKVNLWLEALEPGKPLSFLDAHIQCGNSLLGTTPDLIALGLPDEAFIPLEGDDKAVVSDLKRRNKKERTGTGQQKQVKAIATPLFSGLGTSYGPMIDSLSKEFEVLEAVEDSTLAAIHAKETRYKAMHTSEGWRHAKLVADAWCAAFVWEKTKARLDDEEGAVPITHDDIQRIIESPVLVSPNVRSEIERLSESYGFLHPHIAFPHVFHSSDGTGDWARGFDVLLGNPPWERIKIQEREWFAVHDTAIANAPKAVDRKRLIQALKDAEAPLYRAFADDLRKADGETHLVRNSGRFPLCGRGDINTYSVFTELARSMIQVRGRVGIIVPSGIATDDTTKFFFGDLVKRGVLVSLFDFVNDSGLFPGVGHGRQKFCLLTISGSEGPFSSPQYIFYAQLPEDLADESRKFTLSAEEIELLNPNTGTCAIFRSRADAELTKSIYRRVPILIREAQDQVTEDNPWNISFMTMFHMANDSDLFQSEEGLLAEGYRLEGNCLQLDEKKYLPLIEAKMVHFYTHRWGDYSMRAEGSLDSELPRIPATTLANPSFFIRPRYWVPEGDVKNRSANLPKMVRAAYATNSKEVLLVGLGYWAFGTWLSKQQILDGTTALGNLFDDWLSFVTSQPWAGSLQPTQLGICGDSEGHFQPPGPQFLPAVGLNEMNAQENEQPFWFEVKAPLLDAMIQMSVMDPLDEAEWLAFQTMANIEELGVWLLEHRTPRWFIGWRDICRNSDERTVIASLVPRAGIGNKFPVTKIRNQAPSLQACLLGNLSSFVLDYVARQKIGATSLTYFYLKQFPVLPPETYQAPTPWTQGESLQKWILPRILELVYTAWDVQPFAKDCGFEGNPFTWNEDRRFQIRCELDAAFFYLYGLTYEETAYIMDTFPIVRRKDEAQYGTYRTKEAILREYAALLNSLKSAPQ